MDEQGPDVPDDDLSAARSWRPPPESSRPYRYKTPRERKYLPTFSDLIDRLSIVQLKEIFLPDKAEEYRAERALIQHDIDLMLAAGIRLDAGMLRAAMMVMLTNRYIWENESKARADGSDQDRLLKLTHSINGVRNTFKNEIASATGERLDYKVDCFAADLVKDFGNWNVTDKEKSG